jgi:hypothetical protein
MDLNEWESLDDEDLVETALLRENATSLEKELATRLARAMDILEELGITPMPDTQTEGEEANGVDA